MATVRVGIGSFNINDGSVGIGTEGTGHGNLKVEGTLKSTSADVLGVSTFTRYSGFNADEVKVSNRDLTLSGEYSTMGDVVVEDGASLTVGLGSTACVGAVESISVKHHFSVPVGDIAQRNESTGYSEGTIRYNTDYQTMEFFNGSEWRQFLFQADVQNNTSRGRGRAVTSGGRDSDLQMQFVNIASKGNTQQFGLHTGSTSTYEGFGVSSSTRGLFAGTYPAQQNIIEYITIASEGNSIDYGDLTDGRRSGGSASSSTRGIFAGGISPSDVNIIDYVEIATLGDAIDFGDLSQVNESQAGFQSVVRGFFCGGSPTPAGKTSNIEVVIMASNGNAAKFGDLTRRVGQPAGASNPVRGVVMGGYERGEDSDTRTTHIDYVTLASEGNAIMFGDLTEARGYNAGAASQTRAVSFGGNALPVATNSQVIDFIEFTTTGLAQDFGDMTERTRVFHGLSDCHGGLGGY